MMNSVADYRQTILSEIADIPDEFIPFFLEQVRAYKHSLGKIGKRKKSPAQRLLKLAGALENPNGLSINQYKEAVIEEYLANRL
jgi:hypothetical protein